MKSPIQSVKHIVQHPASGVASGAATSIVLVTTVAKGAARATTATVEEGAVVSSIYTEIWVKADNPNFTVNAIFLKRPAGVANPTFAEMNNLMAYANKKNILAMHQGLAPSGGNVLPLFREWIKIPKGKQRMGLGDIVEVKLSFTGSAGDVCGFATYKELV